MDLRPPLDEWLNELRLQGPLLATGAHSELENMVMFSLSAARSEGLRVPAIIAFLVAASREYQSKAEHTGVSGLFYAWVDVLAGQLRCSFVETTDLSQLPFGCRVSASMSPEAVASAALEELLVEEVPLSEFASVTGWIDADEEASEFVLSVFAKPIGAVG